MAILPVAYLPPVSLFTAMLGHGQVKWDIYENYHKQYYYNRCLIYGPNGVQKLTIPVHRKYEKTPLKDILIGYETDWQKIHWRSFEAAYRRSPYFEFYEDELSRLYSGYEPQSLVEWNMKVNEVVCGLLDIEMKPVYTSEYVKEYPEVTDYRELVIPGEVAISGQIRYRQVFEERYGFIPNLSIIDLLFCEGPDAKELLMN